MLQINWTEKNLSCRTELNFVLTIDPRQTDLCVMFKLFGKLLYMLNYQLWLCNLCYNYVKSVNNVLSLLWCQPESWELYFCCVAYADPTDTRYLSETRRVWVQIEFLTRGYMYVYKILAKAFVFMGGYLLYPIQTWSIAIPTWWHPWWSAALDWIGDFDLSHVPTCFIYSWRVTATQAGALYIQLAALTALDGLHAVNQASCDAEGHRVERVPGFRLRSCSPDCQSFKVTANVNTVSWSPTSTKLLAFWVLFESVVFHRSQLLLQLVPLIFLISLVCTTRDFH
jgi:hypothetical protein